MPRDSDSDFLNGADFYGSLDSSAIKRPVKFQGDIPL